VADPGEGEDKVSALSSFIANAHNEPYAFHTGKGNSIAERKFWGRLWIRHWWRDLTQTFESVQSRMYWRKTAKL